MPDKVSTIENVPSNKVDDLVKGFVIDEATNILCNKSSDDTWIIVAIIPEKAK